MAFPSGVFFLLWSAVARSWEVEGDVRKILRTEGTSAKSCGSSTVVGGRRFASDVFVILIKNSEFLRNRSRHEQNRED